MNFLKNNWPSAIIFITFSVLVVSLTIHSVNQPLEYDEYWAKRLALDAEYDKLFRESALLIEGMGGEIPPPLKTHGQAQLDDIRGGGSQTQGMEKVEIQSQGVGEESKTIGTQKPVSPTFTPHH